eukprot:SAG11_NODE_69_length_18453_cov_37.601613_12_plen_92_part_00
MEGGTALSAAAVMVMDAFLAGDGDVSEGDDDEPHTSLYYSIAEGHTSEEVDMETAAKLVEVGTIDDDTMVYADGMGEWTPFRDCKEDFDWP